MTVKSTKPTPKVIGSVTSGNVAVFSGTTGALLADGGAPSGIGSFSKIEEQTPTGTGTVTFSSLGSFTHLELWWSARGDDTASSTNMQIQFNGDTGANYDRQLLSASSTTVQAANSLGQTSAAIGSATAATGTADMAGTGTIRIFDYRGTTFQKNALSNDALRTSTTAIFTRQFSIGWRSTAAITSFTITLTAGNYVAGTKFTLYGLT